MKTKKNILIESKNVQQRLKKCASSNDNHARSQYECKNGLKKSVKNLNCPYSPGFCDTHVFIEGRISVTPFIVSRAMSISNNWTSPWYLKNKSKLTHQDPNRSHPRKVGSDLSKVDIDMCSTDIIYLHILSTHLFCFIFLLIFEFFTRSIFKSSITLQEIPKQ